MIHSLAGGELANNKIVDIVKVEFEDNKGEHFLYLSELSNLKVGDFVLVPFGVIDEPKKAQVVEIKFAINSQNISINLKRLKYIYGKV